MKKLLVPVLLTGLLLGGCGSMENDHSGYTCIDAETAKTMMNEQADAVVLDVREEYEFQKSHIPGAVLLPLGTISKETAARTIADLDTTVLIYCRSGNRSKKAASALAELGYTKLYEFGGIQDWPYDVTG